MGDENVLTCNDILNDDGELCLYRLIDILNDQQKQINDQQKQINDLQTQISDLKTRCNDNFESKDNDKKCKFCGCDVFTFYDNDDCCYDCSG